MAAQGFKKIYFLGINTCRHGILLKSVKLNQGSYRKALGSTSCIRVFSQQANPAKEATDNSHSAQERPLGEAKRHEFLAETRMLLDIVAKSLYSDKEVFIRELISNASDALEKQRYLSLTSGQPSSQPMEIHISTDKQNRAITFQDTGIGMNKDELISNLGTIARSGSKAFIEEFKSASKADLSNIIGQFGVGFYSSFMVAESVEVYTRSSQADSIGYKWSSDGNGTYEIQEAENVQPGTKIVIRLKVDCREFADEETVKKVVMRYSNFVGSPIFLNGKQLNTVEALWLSEPKDVRPEQHEEFFKFIANSYDRPRFTLHYKTDSPLMIRALLYFPEGKPGLFEMSRDAELGVSLYTRKILITNKADNLLPKWLRFVKGVVDSEDIPLNLSRELLQNSALIARLRSVLSSRVVKFLLEQATKRSDDYYKFYRDYGIFIKEGIVTSHDGYEKEELAKLLRFESSSQQEGAKVGLLDYISRLKDGQREIFYLAAPNRTLAENSPYLEPMKKQNVEVLYCYEPYDELVLVQLKSFSSYQLTSVEKEMRNSKDSSNDKEAEIIQGEMDGLKDWLQTTLKGKIHSVRTTNRLESHPCVVTVEEMAAARQFLRTQAQQLAEEARFALLQPRLEINAKHPIIKKLGKLRSSNPKLAELVAKQLVNNAMVSAGLVEDPRLALTDMNELLTLALEKY